MNTQSIFIQNQDHLLTLIAVIKLDVGPFLRRVFRQVGLLLMDFHSVYVNIFATSSLLQCD